ncbi:unnamed protein product [Cuscuta campestris]|uniref:tRNA (guanine(9)-N(1))-methyltransferase n=1 Tax=Cuscuta campestris TaxID=132261 RepID=A0A484MJ19_9ASTE|nr:unnamed protein product [Cuscuta campestris]
MKRVADFLSKEVKDWGNEEKMRSRFKALSGQRCDWEPLYLFWRDLIIKVSSHLNIFIVNPRHIKHLWFCQSGLSPLCLDRVLVEMCNSGELLPVPNISVGEAEGWRLSQIFRKAAHLVGFSRGSNPVECLVEDFYALTPLLKEKSEEVVKYFCENHWTPSCVVTMSKFQELCGGPKEASAIMSYLSDCRKAKYLVISRNDRIEGVKICLDSGAVPNITSIDYNVLHLIWTLEKLEQQLCLIDQRYEKTRKAALASLKCGNKIAALRFAKELKLVSQSRDKCTNLVDRVEEVLRAIADAESSKKVSEAIQISAQALKDNQISIEEVTMCLEDLDESIDTLKQVDKVLGSNLALTEVDDEDFEGEFMKLEAEIKFQPNQNPIKDGTDNSANFTEVSTATDALSDAFSNLCLKEDAHSENVKEYSINTSKNQFQIHTFPCLQQIFKMESSAMEKTEEQPMSKNAKKKLLKQQRYEAKKAEKKAYEKEQKKKEVERKRKEWEEKLASLGEEEREKLIAGRRELRKERMEKRTEERQLKMEKLREAKSSGQNVVIDLEFGHLMSSSEVNSLVQQIMYCYAVNGRSASPAHLWLTSCIGEMQKHLERLPGYDKWVIEKEERPYIEVFDNKKEKLVYLTADSENVLNEMDPKAVYIIGGLVDRNRWKGITMKKAVEQGIQTAKLPIGDYLKMSSSQVLTVNQVVEIILKFLEAKDWKDSFFQVIPQRKRCESDSADCNEELEEKSDAEEKDVKKRIEPSECESVDDKDDLNVKRQCIEA